MPEPEPVVQALASDLGSVTTMINLMSSRVGRPGFHWDIPTRTSLYRHRQKSKADDDMWLWHTHANGGGTSSLRGPAISTSDLTRSIHNSRIKGTGDLANSIAHQYPISGIGVTPLPHAREPRGRIAVIDLSGLTKPQLERLGCTAVMQEPFPVLRTLFLGCVEHGVRVIIDTVLGLNLN